MTRSPAGLFVVVDGPSGVGKSTAVPLLAQRLQEAGVATCVTREPSDDPIGMLARAGTHEYHGLVLACLIAADRYHHLATTIRPAIAAGKTVICDRYLATSLVLQQADGVPADKVWQLNDAADRPDLTVILLGDPERIRRRAAQRGTYSRFHHTIPDEVARYRSAAADLIAAGYDTIVYDIEEHSAQQVAADLLPHFQQRRAA